MTALIVNNKDPRRQYTVTSPAVVTYSFDFEFLRDDDVAVYLTPVGATPDPVHQILDLYTDYTITGAGVTGGGSITITVTLAIGDIITIERNLAYDRLTDFSVGGQFKSLTINEQLDRLVMQIQQVNNLITNRGLTYLVTESLTTANTALPKLASGQYWKANSAGALTAVTGIPDDSTLRSELASNTSSAPGAALVGYYDLAHGTGATTVDAYLKAFVATSTFDTGDIRITTASYAYGDAPKSGWVWMRDETIGAFGSNATEKEDDNTYNLFVWMWERFTDANAPIYTSARVLSSRGATALADWQSYKAIQLCYATGRALGVSGTTTGLTARTIGDHVGRETVGLTANQNGTHTHNINTYNSQESCTTGSAHNLWDDDKTVATASSGLGAAHENIQPTVFFNIQIKL